MDYRKRKRVGPSSEEVTPAGMTGAIPSSCGPSVSCSLSSASSSHSSSTTAPTFSPASSYHLPQFLTSSPGVCDLGAATPCRAGFNNSSMDASFTFLSSEDESGTSFSRDDDSRSLTLSCGESSLNATLDDERYSDFGEGDQTPSEHHHNSQWGEESADSFGEPSPSPSTSLSSAIEDLSILGSVLSDDIYYEVRRKEEDTPALQIGPEYYKTRPVLVDWMLDVGDFFGFHGATTHLAVAYLDRMLSLMTIERNKLQLVATSCLLIAGTRYSMTLCDAFSRIEFLRLALISRSHSQA
jgi:hypothetical protein